MARYVKEFQLEKPDDFIRFVSEDFFRKEGFSRDQYRTGEYVWAKGDGLMVAQQYIKLEYQNGRVRLEAWLAKLGLPGASVGEMGLTGFWGWAVKKTLRRRVENLIALLNQPVDIPGYVPGAGGAAQGQGGAAVQTAPPQAIPVAVHNPTGKATVGLVLGIISMFAWLIPILGVVCGTVAITFSGVGRKSSFRKQATIGLVLGIIGTGLAVLNWILGIILSFAGMLS